ncbi:MAG: GAF domain-containing protein [Bradymonadaceae bacterium]|nr:GAF domain-containing protein [Lujinxingiaceae bacterium]
MTRTYTHTTRVSMGRDARNDFVLNDGFVSNRHAEILLEGSDFVYRDLRSRHGSLVLVEEVSLHLHDKNKETQVRVINGAEFQVGSTLIRLSITEQPAVNVGQQPQAQAMRQFEEELPEVTNPSSDMRQKFITTAHQPVQALSRRFESHDRRLEVLFRLAGHLNGLTALDEILDLIVEATFDAFPAANFFAATMGADATKIGTEKPFLARVRGQLVGQGQDEEPILSTSILRRVVETRESVLFVKDSLGSQVTQSILDAKITACMCAPLVGQRSLLGVMQVDTRGRGSLFSRQDLDLFSVLASNAAFAIERARLSESIIEMFEGFVAASVNAIEGRDPVTAGHSGRVARYTVELAEVVNSIETGALRDVHLKPNELVELRYAALLHDFGKIAVREDVLQKDARLPLTQLELIEQRFETIKEIGHRNLFKKYVQNFDAGHAPPPAQALAEVEARYSEFARELNEIHQWLQFIASAPSLNDEQIGRVRQLGQRHYIDSHGQRRPYLTPDEVENLSIPRGTLSELEWVNMRSHAAFSEEYLKRIPWSEDLQKIPCIAGAHHEKLDGSGYPLRLTAPAILPQVRMLTISDIFDALTASDRPYRKAAPIEKAVEILQWEANDNKLDKDLVDVFKRLVIPRIEHVIPNR